MGLINIRHRKTNVNLSDDDKGMFNNLYRVGLLKDTIRMMEIKNITGRPQYD